MKPIPIVKAQTFLVSHLNKIDGITRWAQFMGYSRSQFAKRFKTAFSVTPKAMYHNIRVNSIMMYLSQHPDKKHYEVATRFALRDEKALYDYLKYHHNASPTEVKAFSLETAWGRRRR
jgi:methylphosphotriester-DNA--protein-cysteine methyltransferase